MDFGNNLNEERIRALDKKEEFENRWEYLNPIFQEYISILDDAFMKSGNRIPVKYFVKRKNDYEYQFCKNALCSIDVTTRRSKFLILAGKVGAGKTSFIDYIRKIEIPNNFNFVIPFYLNTNTFTESSTYTEFKLRLKTTLEKGFIASFFDDEYEFKREVVKYKGVKNPKRTEVFQIYELIREDDWQYILSFIDNYCYDKKNHKRKLVIFFDNIDENPRSVVRDCRSFANEILSYSREYLRFVNLTILITVRNYNVSFFQVQQSDVYYLPPVDYLGVITKSIEHYKDIIISSINKLEMNIYPPGIKNSWKNKRGGKAEFKLVMEKETITRFLNRFSEYLYDPRNDLTINFLKNLSSGNLKFLTANVFNVFQSCKLPLLQVFQFHFYKKKKHNFIGDQDTLPLDMIIECLMSVQYPYYTIDSSKIVNIYNLKSSKILGNYHNVLVIPRLLFYLLNNGSTIARDLLDEFSRIGYDSKYLIEAIDKCLFYGLLQTDYGIKYKQLDEERAQIKLSDSGFLYANTLFFKFSYLQYTCEDTPVDIDNYIRIRIKYPVEKEGYNSEKYLEKRILSVKKFTEFIKNQEVQEYENVKRLTKMRRFDFYNKYSVRDHGIGHPISSIIDQKTRHLIKTLESS